MDPRITKRDDDIARQTSAITLPDRCPAALVFLVSLEKKRLFGICLHMRTKGQPMSAERRVKVFRNGRNQAVRIPREFEFPGNEAVMRKEGTRLVIEPARPRSLLAVLAGLKALKEEFPPIQDKPPKPIAF